MELTTSEHSTSVCFRSMVTQTVGRFSNECLVEMRLVKLFIELMYVMSPVEAIKFSTTKVARSQSYLSKLLWIALVHALRLLDLHDRTCFS